MCVFGLAPDLMADALNRLGCIVREAVEVHSGQPIDGLVTPGRSMLRPVDDAWGGGPLFTLARRFYRQPSVPFVQLVWSDDEGRFPWDPRCLAAGRQPMLWLSPDDHPESEWTRIAAEPVWPFVDADPAAGVITTWRLLGGRSSLAGVLHWRDGTWEFLDDHPMGVDELAIVPFERLVVALPSVEMFAELPAGRQAWCDETGEFWQATDLVERRELGGR